MIRIPDKTEAAYWAGKTIYARGPLDPDALYDLVDFGSRKSAGLMRAVESGWLVDLSDGRIDICQRARDYYGNYSPPKYKGQVAPPREAVPFKLMTAKHRPDPRARRADALDNSLAAMPSHFGKVTP